MRLVVVHALLVVLVGCGRGVNEQGLLPGRAPTPAPGPDAEIFVGHDAGVDQGAVELGPDAAPAPDAEQIPSCAAIGFAEQVMYDCDEPPPTPAASVRRTPDQRYSCARCAGPGGATTSQSCAAKPKGPGLPWLCVASCSACPFFDCREAGYDGPPCKLVGYPDAGAP
jgi:hypothetical protein